MSKFEAGMEGMVDTYIFETTSLLEQLDDILIRTEKDDLTPDDIAEIFRIMHTIKGSSAMMGLQNMSTLAHAVEDLFFIIREDPTVKYEKEPLYELLFAGSDNLKNEIDVIQDDSADLTDFSELMGKIRSFAAVMKGETVKEEDSGESEEIQVYDEGDPESIKAIKITYEETCLMPAIRAMLLLRTLGNVCQVVGTIPEDTDDDSAGDFITKNGLYIRVVAEGNEADIEGVINNSLNIEKYEWVERKKPEGKKPEPVKEEPKPAEEAKPADAPKTEEKKAAPKTDAKKAAADSIISVKLSKLDALLDLVSEIVITESMVSSSPDLKLVETPLEQFSKSSRQLKKLTDELQDIVMSIRMVPVAAAFTKMSRVVRDMNSKLKKNVELVFEGEDTEADKSVVDILNDPLMHLVRNAVDHGIEEPSVRAEKGKTEPARVTLSAYEESGEVVIKVTDNGAGMDPDKLLQKAERNGILTKPKSEYSEAEALNLIMAAGFSTNEKVTEYSGRGVGMDVVRSNIEKVGGKITVESKLGKGSSFIIKIPLSLSIIEVLGVMVGKTYFSIPIMSIRESFSVEKENIVTDNEGSVMIKLRGRYFPVIKLSDIYGIETDVTDFEDGIMIMCEADGKRVCLFADEIVSDMSVVVKPFSPLLNRQGVKENGMSGCSILGDGSITIILDIKTIFEKFL
ncbi:MAG: chemotaxis protein CheA [Oscillospiraceae bacterium]|nr:chemotaxis protein CheA [Oscillospiraceae bacterium]